MHLPWCPGSFSFAKSSIVRFECWKWILIVEFSKIAWVERTCRNIDHQVLQSNLFKYSLQGSMYMPICTLSKLGLCERRVPILGFLCSDFNETARDGACSSWCFLSNSKVYYNFSGIMGGKKESDMNWDGTSQTSQIFGMRMRHCGKVRSLHRPLEKEIVLIIIVIILCNNFFLPPPPCPLFIVAVD